MQTYVLCPGYFEQSQSPSIIKTSLRKKRLLARAVYAIKPVSQSSLISQSLLSCGGVQQSLLAIAVCVVKLVSQYSLVSHCLVFFVQSCLPVQSCISLQSHDLLGQSKKKAYWQEHNSLCNITCDVLFLKACYPVEGCSKSCWPLQSVL
jgi:hypothetical protein